MVTSARAGGAFVFAPIIRALLDAGGVQLALSGMGAALIASSAPLWLLLSLGGLDAPLADRKRDKNDGEENAGGARARRAAETRDVHAVEFSRVGVVRGG